MYVFVISSSKIWAMCKQTLDKMQICVSVDNPYPGKADPTKWAQKQFDRRPIPTNTYQRQ